MIRINLFAETDSSEGRYLWLKWTAAIVVAVILAVGAISLFVWITKKTIPGAAATQEETPQQPKPEPVLHVPHAELRGLSKRIPYEMLFARSAIKAISSFPAEALPPESVELDSFSVVRVSGVSPSKEAVITALNAFRSSVTLYPKPHTAVKPEGDGFAYTFAGAMTVPLDMRDPFVDSAIARLPLPDNHNDEVHRFERLAEGAGIAIRKGLRYTRREKGGSFHRFSYRMDATGTFQAFEHLLGDLHAGRVNCALGPTTLQAGRGDEMRIEATVFFTAKE